MRGQAAIQARHVKVEDVIFDGPVCRTCRDVDGSAISYPCDAATLLTRLERAERVAEAAAEIDDMIVVPQLLGFSAQKVADAAVDRYRQALTAWQEARDACA